MVYDEKQPRNTDEIVRFEGQKHEKESRAFNQAACLRGTIQSYRPRILSAIGSNNFAVEFMFLQDTFLWNQDMLNTPQIVEEQRTHILREIEAAEDPLPEILEGWHQASLLHAGHSQLIADRVTELGIPVFDYDGAPVKIATPYLTMLLEQGWGFYYEGTSDEARSRPYLIFRDSETSEARIVDALALHKKEKKDQDMGLSTVQFLLTQFHNYQIRTEFLGHAIDQLHLHDLEEEYIPDELLQQPRWRELLTYLTYMCAQMQSYPLHESGIELLKELITKTNRSVPVIRAATHLRQCLGCSTEEEEFAASKWMRDRVEQLAFIKQMIFTLEQNSLKDDKFLQRPADFTIEEPERKIEESNLVMEIYETLASKTPPDEKTLRSLHKKLRRVFKEIGRVQLPVDILTLKDLGSAHNFEQLEALYRFKLAENPPKSWLKKKIGSYFQMPKYGMSYGDPTERSAPSFAFDYGYKNLNTALLYLSLIDLAKRTPKTKQNYAVRQLLSEPEVYGAHFRLNEHLYQLNESHDALASHNIDPDLYRQIERQCTHNRSVDGGELVAMLPLAIMVRDGVIKKEDLPAFRYLLQRIAPYMYKK